MPEQSNPIRADRCHRLSSLTPSAVIAAGALTTLAYFLAGILAYAAFPVGNGLAGIWPAAGVSVAATLLLGPRAIPAIFIGDFLVGLHAGLATNTALVLAFGAAGEALTAWFLLTRVAHLDPRLSHIRDVAIFVVAGVLPSAALCVALRLLLMAAVAGPAAPLAENPQAAIVGLLGHGLGVLLVAPVILTWITEPPSRRRAVEFRLLLLTAVLLNAAAFTASPSGPTSALLYAVFVIVLWAALRFGPRETSSVLLLTAVFATWAAGDTSGPFLVSSQIEALYSLSLFLLVAAITALLLAAAARERAASVGKLEESEHAHRMLIEQMREGVITVDANFDFSFVSDRFCSLSGWERGQLLGAPLAGLVAARDRDRLALALKDARRDDDAQVEVVLERRQGDSILASIAPRRLKHPSMLSGEIMAVVADVTAARRATELARARLQQIAHMGRVQSMDAMAVAFAHEIAQPLTAITSYSQAAGRFLATAPTDITHAREAIDGAEREARRGSEIVRRIRRFVQNRKPERIPQVASHLAEEAARLAEPEVRQHGIQLCTDLCGSHCMVLVDPVQIQQVLLNLVRNAAEAIDEAASEIRTITLTTRSEPAGSVAFSVVDSGPGIDAAEMERIFDPFYTSKADGVGIGLALCRSIIEEHQGELRAASPPGGGATFTFVLKEYRHV
ncbi:MAG: MASE1 domain-containing protein [Rhodocyclales bacterium]|nr:MASE1 domain-containing protein [Rhodocyclales bacterium]